MSLSSITLFKLENEIKFGGLARLPVASIVREIHELQLYRPAYTSIFEYMTAVFKWSRRKTKQILYDAKVYAILQRAFAREPWKLPKFRNQLKGITTKYPELIPTIWDQAVYLKFLPENQRIEQIRAIQKRVEDEYIDSKYKSYMIQIYSTHNHEDLLLIIQNESDPIKLAIVLYFFNYTQQYVLNGLYGTKLIAFVAKLKNWGRDRVKG